MQKNTYRYEQTAALLLVEGYPDLSAGHGSEAIGILSAWRLQLIGTPELEGTRDHLESLMTAVMPYARHQLSGVGRRFGASSSFVSIGPMDSGLAINWNCAAVVKGSNHCRSSSMMPT
jgi:hypothetical protein